MGLVSRSPINNALWRRALPLTCHRFFQIVEAAIQYMTTEVKEEPARDEDSDRVLTVEPKASVHTSEDLCLAVLW